MGKIRPDGQFGFVIGHENGVKMYLAVGIVLLVTISFSDQFSLFPKVHEDAKLTVVSFIFIQLLISIQSAIKWHFINKF